MWAAINEGGWHHSGQVSERVDKRDVTAGVSAAVSPESREKNVVRARRRAWRFVRDIEDIGAGGRRGRRSVGGVGGGVSRA